MQTYSTEEFKKTYGINGEKEFYAFLESLDVNPRVLVAFSMLNPRLMRLVEQERPLIVTEVGPEKDFTMYFGTIPNSTHSYMLTIRNNQVKITSTRYVRKGNGIYQYGKATSKVARIVNGKVKTERYGINLEPKNANENVLTYFGDLVKGKGTDFSLTVSAYTLLPKTAEEAKAVDVLRELPEMMLLEKECIAGTNNIDGISQYSESEDLHSFEAAPVKRLEGRY